MALQIVPSQNPPPVKRSLILAFAGIPQPNPLRPNGRVFRRLAAEVPAFYLDHGKLVEITYEDAFVIRFMRWLGDPLQQEFGELFVGHRNTDELIAKVEAFLPKLRAHEKTCPPPWQAEAAQAAQERAA